MSEQAVLTPDTPVEVGGVTLLSPSLSATVTVSVPDELGGGTRGSNMRDVVFDALLAETDVQEQHTVEFDGVEHAARGPDAAGRGGADFLQLDVRAPIEGVGQVVLDVGVDGVWTWHFGEDVGEPSEGRGAGTRRYVLPADTGTPATVDPEDAAGNRGILGKLGKRVVKVLLFRVLEVGGAWAAEKMVRHWEDAKRPHRLRRVTPANFGDPLAGVPTLTFDDVRQLDGKRSLLLVHGTASRTDSCFRSMPVDVVQALADHYEGRVIALDHPTISYDPVANVQWLSQQIPSDMTPKFDVISHSRGGLVSRLLFERTDLGISADAFETGVLVASPNLGTELASPAKLGSLMDVVTNVVGAAPMIPVTDVLEVVLTVVKQLAVGAMGGLDGLASMDPAGAWRNENLADPSTFLPHYRALGSDFEPLPGAPLARIARDIATDALFSGAGNDLVVPTGGTDLDQQITKSMRIARAVGVDHSGYWANPDATAQIRAWLGA